MSDEELKFATEADKAKAIDTFDESKGSDEELAKIMAAPIVPSVKPDAKADETPPQSEPDKKPETEAQPPAKADATPPQGKVSESADEWAKAKGYPSFAEAKKAFDEKEEALKRSQRFIKEKLEPQGSETDRYSALMTKNQQLETELAALKNAAPANAQDKVANTEDKIAVLKTALGVNLEKRKALIAELKDDPGIVVDANFLARQLEVETEKDQLNLQLVDEINTLRSTFDTTNKRMQDVSAMQELTRQREQNESLYEKEMDEISAFAANAKHPEFAFSENRDSRQVEADYIKWANAVASAVYAGPVDMLRSQNDKSAVAQALASLKNNDPDAVNACRVAGVAVEPSDDVKKYLEICDLLNHRDGQKLNPITGQYEQQYRLVRDPLTGTFRKDPVRLASLEDAYEHRCAIDGTYQNKIKEAYVKGSKDLAQAAQKRAAAPVELDNATGSSATDVGLAMTPADAMKALETIDEAEAMRRKMAGDSTLFDKFEKALGVLETVKV